MLKTIHSYWAYIVLILLTITVINAIIGLIKKRPFTHKDLRLGLFTLIVSHIQLLIGFAWYFMSGYASGLSNMGETMKNSSLRLLSVEHPLMMLIAIVLITIGWSKHKKKDEDTSKFKTFVIFYGIALILILSRIPWNNWLGI